LSEQNTALCFVGKLAVQAKWVTPELLLQLLTLCGPLTWAPPLPHCCFSQKL